MIRFANVFFAVIAAMLMSVVGMAAGSASASPTAEPFAATATTCGAVYVPADTKKVPGEPTELVLKSYSCGEVSTSNMVVVKAFENLNYQGSSVEFQLGSGSECDIDGYRWDSLPGGWNDRISSFRAYATCQGVRLYEDTNTSGSCGSYINDVSYVGDTMNDKASSLRISDRKKDC